MSSSCCRVSLSLLVVGALYRSYGFIGTMIGCRNSWSSPCSAPSSCRRLTADMHRDHPGADWSKRGTQAVRASAEEAAREMEEPSKNAVDKEFMHEKEEKKKPDSDAVAVSV